MKETSTSKGLVIAFLGPDGSGKSTVIEGLKKQELPFVDIHYFHLKPIVKPAGQDGGPVENPHEDPPYGVLKSYLKLLYFIFQYNIGWFRNIRPEKKKSSLVIFDRYFDDMMADPKRYRYGGHDLALRFVRWLIPSPDLFFVLTADARTIYARKQEVSISELTRQIAAYRNLTDRASYISIDVGRTPNEIVKEIKTIIIEGMHGTD